MNKDRQGMRDKVLTGIIRVVGRHPGRVILFSIFLSAISVIYTWGYLEFQTGRSELISQDLEYRRDFKAYREEFGDYDGLVVVARGDNPDSLKEFMEKLGERLKADPAHFMDVFYKINTNYFRDKWLLFLEPDEVDDLFEKLRDNEEFITQLNEDPGLVNLFRQSNFKISNAMVNRLISGLLETEAEGEEETRQVDLSLINNILRQMSLWLDGGTRFRSPWAGFLGKSDAGARNDGYISYADESLFLMTVNPVEDSSGFSLAKDSVRLLREQISRLRLDFPDVKAGVTGVAALESDEMIASQTDTIKASVVALFGVTLIFVAAFRGFVKPVLAVTALVASLCWTLGWTTAFIGHLNVISVVFITILIGLGIDFGIHLLLRYEEERMKNGFSVEESLERAVKGAGKGILVGALTTALAFFTMALADFLGIVELGLIAGSGILLSLASMLIFLPAMLLVVDRSRIGGTVKFGSQKPIFIFALLKSALRFPLVVLTIGFVWAACSVYFLSGLKFDYNLLKLQNAATESVQSERDIINNSDRSSWYGAMIVGSLDEARRLKAKLEALPSVAEVDSILSMYPEDQENKIVMVREKAESAPGFPPLGEWSNQDVNLKRLIKTFKKISFKLKEDKDWSPGKKPDEESIAVTDGLIKEVLKKIERMGPSAGPVLVKYQGRLFGDYADKFDSLTAGLKPSAVKIAELPKPLRERFIGKTGKYLLRIFPRENIWEREPLNRFLTDLRSLDPHATGLAVQAGESSRLMLEGYVQGGIYALATILLITLASFKRLKNSFLAMLPLFVGFLWLIALMEAFDLRFNLANLVIIPLIIGIGVDNGVHVIARYQEGGLDDPVSVIFNSTGKGILLCSLTTMIGFGSLMVADHYGIFSIGLLLALGVGSCLLASITVLPILYRYSEKGNIRSGDFR